MHYDTRIDLELYLMVWSSIQGVMNRPGKAGGTSSEAKKHFRAIITPQC